MLRRRRCAEALRVRHAAGASASGRALAVNAAVSTQVASEARVPPTGHLQQRQQQQQQSSSSGSRAAAAAEAAAMASCTPPPAAAAAALVAPRYCVHLRFLFLSLSWRLDTCGRRQQRRRRRGCTAERRQRQQLLAPEGGAAAPTVHCGASKVHSSRALTPLRHGAEAGRACCCCSPRYPQEGENR